MSNTIRPDFCFSAAVLSGVDAVDIAECFGLRAQIVADHEEDLFDDLNDAIDSDVDDVFYSRVNETATVVARVRA